jgi:Tfp pilus assembly protein PilN
MMLRGNLATRPFYNERAVQVVLTGLAAGLVLLSAFTVWQLVSLTAQQRDLAARIARDEGRAASLRREAQQVRGRLDAARLDATVKATREANAVIDARTFSWTALFNVIERTIPPDVRLQAVMPSIDGEALMVRLVVNTRRVEPVGAFMDRLEAAGAFRDLRSLEEQLLDDGSYNVVCLGRYLGPGAPTPDAPPAPTTAAPAAAGAN